MWGEKLQISWTFRSSHPEVSVKDKQICNGDVIFSNITGGRVYRFILFLLGKSLEKKFLNKNISFFLYYISRMDP